VSSPRRRLSAHNNLAVRKTPVPPCNILLNIAPPPRWARPIVWKPLLRGTVVTVGSVGVAGAEGGQERKELELED
jgi:hypothetical protein